MGEYIFVPKNRRLVPILKTLTNAVLPWNMICLIGVSFSFTAMMDVFLTSEEFLTSTHLHSLLDINPRPCANGTEGQDEVTWVR